ncbi:MAG: amidophosphoribosyltransferase [Candidatus Auribacterota bacterium]|jgi:amidophosphoribosyltransferase|uniref:Amidophosphoribosyltransferase n=1 Tax=Candidatus Auribacter fodinae TaxID=2093366 RepID=A0A3A4R2Q1_9BACT|nr:MAG: amidophosphoribosyltransferase [Candidatus Auribacter fodinae]
MDSDKPREFCGVFGIYGHPDAAMLTYLGLYALQHRGQESAGIVSNDGTRFYEYKNMGLVSEVFDQNRLKELKGNRAIGHVRYSTTGSSQLVNAQPLTIDYCYGTISIGHNGNLTNANELRINLERLGSIFQTSTDSEVIVHLLAKPTFTDNVDRLRYALSRIEGAYSFVMMNETSIIGVRDPHGFRPLCLGKLDGAYVLSSETCAFDLIGAEYVRDVEPGETVIIDGNGLTSLKLTDPQPHTFCIFEMIYFSRPDSFYLGKSVHTIRKALGRRLAQEHPADADVVIAVPDSGKSCAVGYGEESGIPYDRGFIRNHYIGRTFIHPSQSIRNFSTRVKLNPVKDVINGKRVVVIDDSIVRGTTSRSRISALRDAGAKEIHMRISCPPHISPCYYGIDFPSNTELIASLMNKNTKKIAEFIGADTLGYLSLEGMLEATGTANIYCMACYTGDYPVKPSPDTRKLALEKHHPTIKL